jgi:FkbM family methyltransferase
MLSLRSKNLFHNMPLYSLSTNFMQYCFEHTLNFDTSQYFTDKQDDALIMQFIDSRIKCVAAGFEFEPMTPEQVAYKAEEKKLQRKVRHAENGFSRLTLSQNTYYLPFKAIDYVPQTFTYHYGLTSLPDKMTAYIAGKDFLDIGAYWGDTSLMLLQYHPHQIFAYEPTTKNYTLLQATIRRNKAEDKICAVKKGCGDEVTTLNITIQGSSSSVVNLQNSKEAEVEAINITTIDHECESKHVGLIKMDIEGFEYFALKGALATINRDRPILLISIYHTGKDFFEIPPMIQHCCPSYRFKFVDLMPSTLYEKVIIGYDSTI